MPAICCWPWRWVWPPAAQRASGTVSAPCWFYLATYAAATIGAFAVLEHLGRPERRLDAVDELAGLGRTRPAAAAVLAVCMFSLAGVPPLAGFWGKFLVFGSALNVDAQGGAVNMQWWFIAAAVIGVLNAAVAAAYYLRIVAVMYFRTPLATPRAEGGAGSWWAAVACALLVIGVGVYPGPLMHAANESAATPACPAIWNGGHKSSCPDGLSRSAFAAIIEDGNDTLCVTPKQGSAAIVK